MVSNQPMALRNVRDTKFLICTNVFAEYFVQEIAFINQ